MSVADADPAKICGDIDAVFEEVNSAGRGMAKEVVEVGLLPFLWLWTGTTLLFFVMQL